MVTRTIMRLNRKFFNRSTTRVAKDLLGAFLVRRVGQKVIRAKIIEVEAYCGEKDLACHASKGRTARTEIMYGQPGLAYIFMIYGMYYCFNVVTREQGRPEAVLIRALDCLGCEGPGKLCREFKIDKKLNGIDLTVSDKIWIEKNSAAPQRKIKASKRIGVEYAGKWKDKPWRYMIEN
jgi:DNA-3-methyladenine glycosylase